MADAALLVYLFSNMIRRPNRLIATMEECQSLQRTLASIRLLIVDISRYDLGSKYVEESLKEITGIVGEAEDAVNFFLVLASVHRSKSWMSRPFYPKGFWDARKQIEHSAHKAKVVDELVIMNLLTYSSADQAMSTSDRLRMPTHDQSLLFDSRIESDDVLISYLRDNWKQTPTAALPLVGHEDTIRAVIDDLCSDSKYLEIVPIVGVEGVGKTTVAKRILNDSLIQAEFPVRAFIHVSKEHDFREILIAILSSCSAVSSKTITQSEEELALAVREHLKRHRYLIIMDDVRNREDWDKLKAALSNNKMGSRVLITTRHKFVAAYANPCAKPHVLRLLTDGENGYLFRLMFFGEANGNHGIPMKLESFFMSVAELCAGMPFATVLVAAYLKVSERRDFYYAVQNLRYSYIPRDLPRYLISVLYQEMDESMKLCFLYLGIFPKGFQITVSQLLRLWIAEGFDKGEEMLRKLMSLNIVVVGKRSLNGEVKTCQLYEMVAEFCKQKGMEENFFQDILKDNKTRRVCISSSELDKHLSTITPFGENNLRSFLTTKRKEAMLTEKHMDLICKSKYLKVLDVGTFTLPRFPAQVLQLFLLKYIAIRGSIRTVPSQVSSILLNLETLDVETTYKALEIRATLWKMQCFRHLLTDASAVLRIPAGKKEMLQRDNIHTMSTISPQSCRGDVFYCTPNLRKLGIRGDLALLNFSILCMLEYLEKLKLLGVSTRFPLQTPVFPPRIQKLTLMNTQLSWSQMSIVGNLKRLTFLKLKGNACVGDAWTTNDREFKVLEVLHLGKTNLSIWNAASAAHFPRLKFLLLKFCDSLQGIPESLADIRALHEIRIQGATPGVAASAKKIQELKLQRGNGILELSIA